MSEDSHTVTTSESWGGRLGGAVKGILVGFVLFTVSIIVLFWNEGRAVRTARTLEEGGNAVITAPADSVLETNEGKLIHLSGRATAEGRVTDDTFKVSAPALRLIRSVEMYQWKESSSSKTKDKLGGGTETVTVYDYTRDWSENAIDSSKFNKPEGHANPGKLPYSSKSWTADKVTLGAFRLPGSLVAKISNSLPLEVTEASLSSMPESADAARHVRNGRLYLGADPATPTIGDVRIGFRQVPPSDVSVIAKQKGDTLEPYRAAAGGTIEMLKDGLVSADDMFSAAMSSNKTMTWVMRLVGFILMGVGIGLVLKPLAVAADIIPFVGNLVEAGTGFVSFIIALCISLVTIALGWIFYRPVIGGVLLALAVGVIVGGIVLAKKRKAKKAAVAAV